MAASAAAAATTNGADDTTESASSTAEPVVVVDVDVASILKANGHDVTMAENGLKGLAACLRNPPDLVLTDVQMPMVGCVVSPLDADIPGLVIVPPAPHGDDILSALELLAQVAFVGSHPMAGSEKTGPAHAQADLFEGRVAVVTPSRQTSTEAVDQVERFWRQLGSQVVRMSPKDHDRSVAAISHMPHLVASALAAATPEEELQLASTGWLDTTRIAGGAPELWRQILVDNRSGVLKSLDKFEKVLASFRRALERQEHEQLLQLLEAGKQRRDSLGN